VLSVKSTFCEELLSAKSTFLLNLLFLKSTFMQELFEKFNRKIRQVTMDYQREALSMLTTPDRLVGIRGARGVGKTTLLMQYANRYLPMDNRTLYVSLDDLYFSANTVYGLAFEFVRQGGTTLLLDEVHRYSNWSVELKNIYDDFPELRVVFTGSSILHLDASMADLSRRSVIFRIQGLSFREYLALTGRGSFAAVSIGELLQRHMELSSEIASSIRPLVEFDEYLRTGYYPYFTENIETYQLKLSKTVNQIIEGDLPFRESISQASIQKVKKLMYLIATSVPYTPNIQKLSSQTELTRNSVTRFIHLLGDADLLMPLSRRAKGNSVLQKPDKLYLHHPNLAFALASANVDKGSMRETFFLNQLSFAHEVNYPEKGDFLVNGKYLFEVGGRNKDGSQISSEPDAFIAMDGMETGFGNRIPLWLFGFLY